MLRRVLHLGGAGAVALVLVTGVVAATAGADVRVSTHDLITSDAFASSVGGPADVLQQNEPHIAVHPTNASLLAVGMNDVRTLGVSGDAWQGLAVSSDGGATYTESLIPGYPGDTSAATLPPRIRGSGSTASATCSSRSSRFSGRRRVSQRTRRQTHSRLPSTRPTPLQGQ